MVDTLDRLIGSARVPRDTRVLVIGKASQAAQNQIDLALENHKGPRLTAEDDSAEGELFFGDPTVFALPRDIGICFVTVALSRYPDAFEELLHGILKDAVRPGGVVALQLFRDTRDAAFDKLKTHENVRVILRDFLKHQFGEEAVGSEDIAGKFEGDGAFEYLGWASRTNRPADEEPIVWLVLRRRASGNPALNPFPRTRRADRFAQTEISALIARLKAGGIAFLPIDGFAERLRGAPDGFGLLKLDIHRGIHRVQEAGRLLQDQGIHGLFLMMHRHALNADYYDAPATWDILRELVSRGHEVGLHLDPFHMIREYGDLHAGIEAALADMHRRGLAIRAATLHGDTAVHLRARKLFAYDFFEEMKFRSTWDGEAPSSEPIFAEHVGRYSFKTLAEQFSLRWFAEANFVAGGEVLTSQPLAYLSDNRKTMMLLNTPGGDISDEVPFHISDKFTARAAEALKTQPFLALFHPQWMW
ncbi:MAG: hypothetical protein WDM89_20340 [Rhizomicrobium sp.]